MKINGREFKVPNECVVVIPRGGEDIVFKARAVLDETEFKKLCPPPRAPIIQRPGQQPVQDTSNLKFNQELQEWGRNKQHWLVIQSLKATPGLTWDEVKENDPSTWKEWIEELKKAFFTEAEITKIFGAVMRASALDEDYLEQARQNFFLAEAQRAISSSQKGEPMTTPSGEPASDSQSAHPA